MRDFNLLCMGCMKMKPDTGICPYCHFDLEQYQRENAQKGLHYLQPGSILNGRYMAGKVLGEGELDITYIGWDLNIDIPIAIKEYFPKEFMTRNANQTDSVTILSSGEKGQFYLKQKERFLDEAKTLKKMDDTDMIMSIRDYFAENGTVYIIMEYLDNKKKQEFQKKRGQSNYDIQDTFGNQNKYSDQSTQKQMEKEKTSQEEEKIYASQPQYQKQQENKQASRTKLKFNKVNPQVSITQADISNQQINGEQYQKQDKTENKTKNKTETQFKIARGVIIIMTILIVTVFLLVDNSDDTSEGDTQGSELIQPTEITIAINPGYDQIDDDGEKREKSNLVGKYSELPEYELNLEVAQKLREKLEKRGYTVIMTREGNYPEKEEAERIKQVIEDGADILITLRAETEENCGDECNKPYPKAFISNDEDCEFYNESELLSQSILREYCNATGFDNNNIWHYEEFNPLEVDSDSTGIPTMILSMGHIDDEYYDKYMADGINQETMAEGIAKGVDAYLYYAGIKIDYSNFKKEEDIQSTEQVVGRTGKIVAVNPGYELMYNDNTVEPSFIVGKYTKLPEYELNLQVAKKLETKLKERGYQVILTRDSNNFTEVKSKEKRIEKATEDGADILISLHAETRGVHDQIYDEDVEYHYTKAWIDMDSEESKWLASFILGGYCTTTGMELGDNGVLWGYSEDYWGEIFEAKSEKIPSVALVMGGMDDKYCDEYMADEDNQEMMAEGIAAGIDAYFEEYGE